MASKNCLVKNLEAVETLGLRRRRLLGEKPRGCGDSGFEAVETDWRRTSRLWRLWACGGGD